MRRNVRIYFAISMLGLAALACQAVSGGETPAGENPQVVAPTAPASDEEPATANVILSDDFSSAKWGTSTDSDSAVEYVDGTLQMIVHSRNWFVWSTPDNSDYSNIHMEVTVINNDTDSTTAFGLICNKTSDSDFHYVAMTPAGQYAIARAVSGETDFFLTNNDQWADSGLIPVNAPSYRVGMDCGNGRLALYVNGQRIAAVSDSTHTSGQVAVFTWSGEEATNTNVSFDDFLMTALP